MTVQSASDLSKAVYAGTLPVWAYCGNGAYADTKPFMELHVHVRLRAISCMILICYNLMLSQNSFSLFLVTDFYIFFIEGVCKCHFTMILATTRFKKNVFPLLLLLLFLLQY